MEFFEISSKYFTIASTILVVRMSLGADERADNGDDRDDRRNQFVWLKLPNQAEKGRVIYLVDQFA